MKVRRVPLVAVAVGLLASLAPCSANTPCALLRGAFARFARCCVCTPCTHWCTRGAAADPRVRGAGGHFRYATMFWQRTADETTNTIEVTIESAWRKDYSSTYMADDFFTAALGSNGESLMKINGKQSPKVDFGDGSPPAYLEGVRITAYSDQENWFLGEQKFLHTFETPNNAGHPWEIKFTGCCRTRNLLQDQADKPWAMTVTVDLLEADASPRIVSLPVIHVVKVTTTENVNSTFTLHTAEHDPSITWTLGNELEGQYVHPDGTVEIDTQADGIPADCMPRTEPGCGGHTTMGCAVNVMAYAHYAGSKLSVPVDLVVIMVAAPYPTFTHFPPKQTARVGFKLEADIKAAMNNASSDVYVGFTVGTLPNGLHLSTVRGKGNNYQDEAIMSLRWTPCFEDLGSHVLCVDAVNNHGMAATQRCLVIDVVADAAPTLMIEEVDTGKVLANASSTSDLMMGLMYEFKITAMDVNGLDSLTVVPVPAAPEDDCTGESSGHGMEGERGGVVEWGSRCVRGEGFHLEGQGLSLRTRLAY